MLAKTSTTLPHGHSADGPVVCQNCDHEYVGRYCSQCGQRADTHRVNWHYIWHDIPHSIFHYDSGILFTLRELITRPGYTIRDFLNGKRVKHYRPLALLIILAGIYVFISHFLNVSFAERSQEAFDISASDKAKAIQREAMQFYERNQKIITIVLIPLNAFWFWLLFRRRGYNYPEILVAQTFVTNFSMMISLLIVLLTWVLGSWSGTTSFVLYLSATIMVAYNAWVYTQLFREELRPLSIIGRATVAYVVSFASLSLVGGISGIVYGISIGITDTNAAKSKQTHPTTVQRPH